MTLLEARDLSKSYGELQAVDSVSLEVAEGAFQALIGPNGAGKTTFFNMLCGETNPTSGQVFFDGREITDMAPNETARLGMAKSFQTPHVFPDLTIFENVRIMAQAFSDGRWSMLRPKSAFEGPMNRATEVLDLLDLESKQELLAKNLSHGDMRKLEIGLSLASDPQLLLLDEPTAGLSEDEQNELADLLTDLNEDHTIFLIDHEMDFVMSLSDKVCVLHNGSKLINDSPEEVRATDRVHEVYFGGEKARV